MLGIAGYCLYRAPKQPVGIQKLVMVLVAGMFAVFALVLAAPLLASAGSMVAGWKAALHGGFWFLLKVFLYIYLFMWLRFTFPRYRFDQLMRLGWQFLIPVSIVNVVGIATGLALNRQYGWSLWISMPLTTVVTIAVAAYLGATGERKEPNEAIVGEFWGTGRDA